MLASDYILPWVGNWLFYDILYKEIKLLNPFESGYTA